MEYKIIITTPDGVELQLNALATAGWRLVWIIQPKTDRSLLLMLERQRSN